MRLGRWSRADRQYLCDIGFIRLLGSVYRTEEKDDIDSIFDFVDELSAIKGLKECVNSVHGFRMEGSSI